MKVRRLRRFGPLGAATLVALLLGCASDTDTGSVPQSTSEPRGSPSPAVGAREFKCPVGERPDYFVPGGAGGAIIGCARLATSHQLVRFSADPERIARDDYVCLNPAYPGRRTKGLYIPSTCSPPPLGRRVEIWDAREPRQGVRGYGRVIWGTAPAAAKPVIVEVDGVSGRAASFTTSRGLGSRVGAGGSFTLFVAEVPADTRCRSVVIRAGRERENASNVCGGR